MEIYLTDEELQREKDLFSPSDTTYEPLEGRAYDISTFVEEISEDYKLPGVPPSC